MTLIIATRSTVLGYCPCSGSYFLSGETHCGEHKEDCDLTNSTPPTGHHHHGHHHHHHGHHSHHHHPHQEKTPQPLETDPHDPSSPVDDCHEFTFLESGDFLWTGHLEISTQDLSETLTPLWANPSALVQPVARIDAPPQARGSPPPPPPSSPVYLRHSVFRL